MPLEKEHIVNGIKYYSILDSTSHRFCLALYVRAGVLFENESENGITHMFEHIVFRNIKRKYNNKLYQLLKENCLIFNATTYKEFVYFYITGMPQGFDFAAEVMASVFDDITVSGEELKAEKRRVKSEIREDAEKTTLDYFSDCILWEGTSLNNTITGTCKTVDRISRRRLNEFKNEVLCRDNFFFYLTGNVSKDNIKLFEKTVSSLNVSESKYLKRNAAPVPEHFGKRKFKVNVKEGTYYHVKLCFDIDNAKYSVGARDILFSALFDGEDAMFYIGLSDEDPLIYSFDSFFERYDNISVLQLDYEVSKRHLCESITRVFSIFDKLKNGDFNFENELKWRVSAFEMLRDDPEGLNWQMAYENHILSERPVCFEKKLLGRYAGLTKNEVVKMAQEVFVAENLTLALRGSKDYVEKLDLKIPDCQMKK